MRVYEFGPESGRKVLMVHGISTSCQTLSYIARDLVDKAGCRVLLFDLFGRGFTDGVTGVPHDARLYVTQCLLALASSPLAWSGDAAFDLLGYSMGGGVAVHLAAAFPHMIRSLILLAPAGLIRPQAFGVVRRFVFQSGLIPDSMLAAITRKVLQRPLSSSTKRRRPGKGTSTPSSSSDSLSPTPPTPVNGKPLSSSPLEDGSEDDPLVLVPEDAAVDIGAAEIHDSNTARKDVTPLNARVLRYVQWMLQHHPGFIPAFTGCVRHAPLTDQHETWAKLGTMPSGTVCVILGDVDQVIHADELEADAMPLLGGRERVGAWEIVPGGHDFPMTHPAETVRAIYKFWGVNTGS